jgi:hypothetical protein
MRDEQHPLERVVACQPLSVLVAIDSDEAWSSSV